MALSSATPLAYIKKITPAYQKRLLKLNLKTVSDLFQHYPRRYDDFSNIKPIADLMLNETATVQGRISEIKTIRTWKRRMFITEAYIQDQTGLIKAVWFNQPFIANSLKEGYLASFSGKLSSDKELYFSNPAWERIYEETKKENLRHTGRLVPVYSETAGLTSRYFRYLLQMLADSLPLFSDWLPPQIKQSQNLLDLPAALREVHFPSSPAQLQKAKRRLGFEEIFLIQLFALREKARWRKNQAIKIGFDQKLIREFVAGLPFKLTDSQRKSAWEILSDIGQPSPMNRLLEGDVGSGKTAVAALAMLQTAKAGCQAALMAPTEILAQQHFKTIDRLLSPAGLRISLLTGANFNDNQKATANKQEILEKIKNGTINIAIGTHALIQKDVKFKNLALAVVDEQHRFGVAQRAALQKNVLEIDDGASHSIPHLLSMTATPIPRTLALALYGDLDISLLDELPKGRQEIETKIISPRDRQKAYLLVKEQIKQGRQAFVICPRIETDQTQADDLMMEDKAEIKAVKEEYEKLTHVIFPQFKVSMLHGRMKAKEKEKIMADFASGKTDILISTSVIEVGIDVPNASVIMIEGSDRFGLAQIHQLRGRVGRGQHKSFCLLLIESDQIPERLKAIISAKSGFDLAQMDLKLRGPGQFFGTRQWGIPDISMASLTDIQLIRACRQEAEDLLKSDPELNRYPALKEKLDRLNLTIHQE